MKRKKNTMNNKPMFARIRKSKTIKALMAFTAINFVVEMAFPTVAMALTSGSASPEFASFEPVATTDMVNDFTGDFTYNLPVLSVPGPDGGGYSMSLSYHSGASSEEEASWVGFGWTLNPGAINRQKRGFADDFKGVDVVKYNKVKPNWTHTTSFNFNMEYNSADEGEHKEKKAEKEKAKAEPEGASKEAKKVILKSVDFMGIPLFGGSDDGGGDEDDDNALVQPSISFNKSIRYNNYSGFAITNGFGIGAKGMASLNMNRSGDETTLGFSVSPIGIFQTYRRGLKKKRLRDGLSEWATGVLGKDGEKMENGMNKVKKGMNQKARNGLGLFNSSYSSWTFDAPAVPYSVAYNYGRAYNYSGSLQINPTGPLGFQAGLRGSVNYQVNYPQVTTKAYGYMYNPKLTDYTPNIGKKYDDNNDENVDPNNDAIRANIIDADYQIEKPSTFNKHDRNLGIPFNNADVFTATGNGVVGGFKFYHDNIGHYYPTFVTNGQTINQRGFEVGIGGTISVGLDAGVGFQKTVVRDWRAEENNDLGDYQYDNNSLPYMAFNGDMGGQVDYTGSDDILTATIGGGYMNRKLNLTDFGGKTNIGFNNRRSSYIDYDRVSNNPSTPADYLVDGITVVNKDGNTHRYLQPVYTRDEVELTVGLPGEDYSDYQAVHSDYIYNTSVNIANPLVHQTVMGQRIVDPYVSSYLLSEVTTFDYVDANGNLVADEDDFGGWTKFDYQRAHTDYRYRAPYQGVIFNRGKLHDEDDQTGSMSTGLKEVYYTKSIETKTHIAFFVTNETNVSTHFTEPEYPFLYDNGVLLPNIDLDGSGIPRTDGIDATDNGQGRGNNALQNLERIVLYSKSDLSKPISTTYFNYDYKLCQGIPNSSNGTGKLTLKKVWTESGGTVKSKIAPYQFEYEYFVDYPDEILDPLDGKYKNLVKGYDHLSSFASTNGDVVNDQNPAYEEGLLDPWGAYRLFAKERFKNMQPWVRQDGVTKKDKDNDGIIDTYFDPAAWQLKRIILPSGGEIHVQYEQKDYRFVQDKEATAMVNLLDDDNFKDGYRSGKEDNNNSIDQNRFYINHEAIGIIQHSDIQDYVIMLHNYFVARKNKLYFKMLYAMTEGNKPRLDYFYHSDEYITGYTAVNDVQQDPVSGNIYLTLGELEANGDGGKDKTLPRYVCYQQLLSAGGRSLGWNARNVDQDDDAILAEAYQAGGGNGVDENDLKDLARDVVKTNTSNFFADWIDGDIKNRTRADACRALNLELSYFKLPTYHAKKGGGIRVKRLLSYDPGIAGETGDAMVYGSEYIYKNEDGKSSGVATNEPQSIREENALVTVLERNKQSGWNKMFKGRDSKQYEGPLGESLLPGAQVVHERVIIKNIHSGRTTTGYAVNKYHTVKDFPMKVDFSEISKDGESPTYKKYNLSLPLGLINVSTNKAWVTQGYVFKLNDMNGKPESQATYAGNYSKATFKEAAYTSKTTYQYSSPGADMNTMVFDPSTQDFELGQLKLGQEEDLTMYRSRVDDKTHDLSLELDLNINWSTVNISLGFGVSYNYQQNELSQHVTSKVLRQKSYLQSTTTTTDGVTQITKNIAFDKFTGDPVLTQTFDGYMDPNETIHTQGGNQHDGHYYALNIPASWMYTDMRAKSFSPTNSNQLTASVGNVVTYGTPITVTALNSGALSNVVNASATVYKKDWFTSANPNQVALEAEYAGLATTNNIAAVNTHYYPNRTYVYRDGVTDANGNDKIYGGGIIANPMDFFKWVDTQGTPIDYSNTSTTSYNEVGVNNNWYSASEIISYSPHGYPIQEEDVLNISSTAKFGYANTLPVLVAQNARYDQVTFLDFEAGNSGAFATVVDDAHSGRGSFDLHGTPNQVFASNYNFDNEVMGRGVSIKLWLKSSLDNNANSTSFNIRNPNPGLKANINNQFYNFKRVAQTGDWSLYVADINYWNGLQPGLYDVKLSYSFMPNELVLVDDFRIQPQDAVMNCTVYTLDNKVATQFDDQHFGVYYEYNNKGQLVRKAIETERGKKTLQEQQYNTPLIPRN